MQEAWLEDKLPLPDKNCQFSPDHQDNQDEEGEEHDQDPSCMIFLPVVLVKYEAHTHAFDIVLTLETEKPVAAFSDHFWHDFLSQAIPELENVYRKGCLKSLSVILASYLLFVVGLNYTVGLRYSYSLMLFLTMALLIHCQIMLSKEFAVCYIFAVLLMSLINFPSLQSFSLIILALTMFYSLPSIDDGVASIHSFLGTVNVHCYKQLKGYQILYRNRNRGGIENCFVFSRTTFDGEAALCQEDESLELEENLVLQDFYLSLGTLYLYTKHLQQEKGETLESLSLIPPTGVPIGAWNTFLVDICEDICVEESSTAVLSIVSVINFLVSLAYFVFYNEANWLLPLHMSSPLCHKRIFRAKMKRKIEIIGKLGSSLLGPTFQLSYHPMRWYTLSNDFLALKPCVQKSESAPTTHRETLTTLPMEA